LSGWTRTQPRRRLRTTWPGRCTSGRASNPGPVRAARRGLGSLESQIRLPRKSLVLLGAGAVVVRLAYLAAFARDYSPRSDADHYETIAAAVANGRWLDVQFPFDYRHPTAFRPPLYPLLLGGFYRVTGVHVGVGQLLNVALGASVVVLAALIAAHVAGRRGGILAGIAVAVYPPLLANDVVLLSEPLSLALTLLVVLLLMRDRPVWAGLTCGLLMLTRPSAQLLVVVLGAWVMWRFGWRAAARFAAVAVLVAVPWVVRNWVLVGSPTLVTSNGYNLVAVYSEEAEATEGFAEAIFDPRFRDLVLQNRNEAELDRAYRDHALDAIRDDPAMPLRAIRHHLAGYFELQPGDNESAERDDGRNIAVRNVTLPLFYLVTIAGVVGLWRLRRRRGAELLLLVAAYLTVASLAAVAAPRLRGPLDLVAAIGVGLLLADLTGRREPEATAPPPREQRWSRRTRVLVAIGVIGAVVVGAATIGFARNRVQDDARSQLRRTLERDGPAVDRLAVGDASGRIAGSTPPPAEVDFARGERTADRLWLLSPRFSGGLRRDTRDAARTLDEALLERRILELVIAGAPDLDNARTTYETRVRATNRRLPGWSTIAANTTMRQAMADLDRLEHELRDR
jgi:hypothetical protein